MRTANKNSNIPPLSLRHSAGGAPARPVSPSAPLPPVPSSSKSPSTTPRSSASKSPSTTPRSSGTSVSPRRVNSPVVVTAAPKSPRAPVATHSQTSLAPSYVKTHRRAQSSSSTSGRAISAPSSGISLHQSAELPPPLPPKPSNTYSGGTRSTPSSSHSKLQRTNSANQIVHSGVKKHDPNVPITSNYGKESKKITAGRMTSGAVSEVNKVKDCALGRVNRLASTMEQAEELPEEVMAKHHAKQRPLRQPNYRVGSKEQVLQLSKVSIYQVVHRNKKCLANNGTLTVHRSTEETVAILSYTSGSFNITFYTNISDKPTFRVYRFHYLLPDYGSNAYMIEIARDTSEEDIQKLELIFYYYSSFFRLHGLKPGEETKLKSKAKPVEKFANGLEGAGHTVGDIFVSAGVGVGKGAKAISDVYIKNTKKYEGTDDPEKMERFRTDKERKDAKAAHLAESIAKGSDSVVEGFKDGVKYVGQRAKKGAGVVKDTEWYQKREAKKKKKKEEDEKNGIQRDPGFGDAAVDVFKAGWNATRAIKDGITQGVFVGATGIRDAKVSATRHTDGEYEAMKTKRRWNTVGHGLVGYINVMSIFALVATSYVSLAIYAAGGAIKYDLDKPLLLGGAPWKEGWLLWRSSVDSGAGYYIHWAVLTTHTLGIYKYPNDARERPEKPLAYYKLSGIKGVFSDEKVAKKPYSIILSRSRNQYFSTEHLRNPGEEQQEWMNLIFSLSEFHQKLSEDRAWKSEYEKLDKGKNDPHQDHDDDDDRYNEHAHSDYQEFHNYYRDNQNEYRNDYGNGHYGNGRSH